MRVPESFKNHPGLDRAMYATDEPLPPRATATALQERMGFSTDEPERINRKNTNRLFVPGL